MIAALYEWAAAQIAEPVIWANQDGPQPDGVYCTLQVAATSREGMPDIFTPDAAGDVLIRQGQLLTLSINVYGDDVTATIQTLRDSLERITVQRDLRTSGVAYVRVLSGPQDLPQVTGSTWQQRAQMDVQFRANVDIIDGIGVIETVAYSGGNGTASDTGATVGGA